MLKTNPNICISFASIYLRDVDPLPIVTARLRSALCIFEILVVCSSWRTYSCALLTQERTNAIHLRVCTVEMLLPDIDGVQSGFFMRSLGDTLGRVADLRRSDERQDACVWHMRCMIRKYRQHSTKRIRAVRSYEPTARPGFSI